MKMFFVFFFFFSSRRRHTRFKCDWSSDVCSSDLERHGADNVTLEIGDAARGWERHAPYHVIVLTGSSGLLPGASLDQLAIGARLFAVVGGPPVMSARLVSCTGPGAFHSLDLF